jgi:hypothetical protein
MINIELIVGLKEILEEYQKTKETILLVSKEETSTLDRHIETIEYVIELLQKGETK